MNGDSGDGNDRDGARLDKWLWAARFFKTRSQAAKAVTAGHVTLDGQKVKTARALRPGDVLGIRTEAAVYTVRVLALADRRGPAATARLLYEETPESAAEREAEAERRRLMRSGEARPERRPDKRQRRMIRQFLNRE